MKKWISKIKYKILKLFGRNEDEITERLVYVENLTSQISIIMERLKQHNAFSEESIDVINELTMEINSMIESMRITQRRRLKK